MKITNDQVTKYVIRPLIVVACIFVAIGYGKAMIAYFALFLKTPRFLQWLGGGAALYIILWLGFFGRRPRFWSIFEHEMTHALFAMLFFKKIELFKVERGKGGEVKMAGRNWFIALSPYFFTMVTVPVILLKPSVPVQYQTILNAALGYFLMVHIINFRHEFHAKQPDIKESGLFFSIFVIIALNMFFLGICLSSLRGRWSDMLGFIQMGYEQTRLLVIYVGQVFFYPIILFFSR